MKNIILDYYEAKDKIDRKYEQGFHFYVYGLIYDLRNKLFYIGKGTGYRILSHVDRAQEDKDYNDSKHNKVRSLLKEGASIKYFFFGFYSCEEKAFSREEAMIYKYGRRTYEPWGILYNTSLGGRLSNYKWNTDSIKDFLNSKVDLTDKYDFSNIELQANIFITNIIHKYCGKPFNCSKSNLLKIKTCPVCQGSAEDGHKLKSPKDILYKKAQSNCKEQSFKLISSIGDFDNSLLDINLKIVKCLTCGKVHKLNTRKVVEQTLNCYVCRRFSADISSSFNKMQERCDYFWSKGSFTLINMSLDESNRKVLEIDCPKHGKSNIPTDWISKGKACPQCFKLSGYGKSGNGYHINYVDNKSRGLF